MAYFKRAEFLAQDGVKWLTLQWGRVLMNAETDLWVDGRLRGKVLQWGRVLMNAGHLSFGGCSDGIASMGPRSHERGNRTVTARCTRPGTSFNGAAFS